MEMLEVLSKILDFNEKQKAQVPTCTPSVFPPVFDCILRFLTGWVVPGWLVLLGLGCCCRGGRHLHRRSLGSIFAEGGWRSSTASCRYGDTPRMKQVQKAMNIIVVTTLVLSKQTPENRGMLLSKKNLTYTANPVNNLDQGDFEGKLSLFLTLCTFYAQYCREIIR